MVKLNNEIRQSNSKLEELPVGGASGSSRFHAFIVQPLPGFDPKDWRAKPSHYQILSYEGPLKFRGRADAWLFVQNKVQAEPEQPKNRWAIYIDRLGSQELGEQATKSSN